MLDAHKVRWETRDLQELLLQRFGMFEMDEQAESLEQTYDDVVRLTLGKSELPVHPAITDAMVAALRDPKRSSLVYPLGLPELRAAIADYEGQARGRSVDPQTVVVSVGSSTIFRNLFTLLSYQGGEILIPRPYYSLYLYSAALAGARVGYYDIDPGTGRIDFDSLGAAIGDATRAVVVCSPGNPLGNLCTRADFERLDALVAGRAVIVSDEIYRNVSFDDAAASMGSLEDPRSQIVVTNAFSKGFRMYARRVGYAVMPRHFVPYLSTIQDHTLLTTDTVPQFGALEALRHLDEVEQLCALYRKRRDYAMERLGSVPTIRPYRSAGSFYLTVDVSAHVRPGDSDRSLTSAMLESTHVATVPGSDFGLPGTIRLSFSAQHFDSAIDRLVTYFAAGV
ncbi:MAG TPA: aminotransferase class I/II-fold pyridoxal phosphate-dependent enzyme [Streptosporangiaceae bacterium]|nr:aminotransferase class I/II-fold pyridoxal phosphate-dependent enzyme [Streptosporangiaceae bacterium]